jgi:alkanesulfonate monooxygenase SsuD/methylene tetrahydromethanopterin reductase-like flavin-dependent oxidoreductase (luciferase family)
VEQARLYDVPDPPVPIYVSAVGPKSMALAGKIGDGLVSFSEPASQPQLRHTFEEGASDPDPRNVQRRAEQDVPLEQAHRGWLVSEDPHAHAQSLQNLIDRGVTHIFVHSPQPDQDRVVRFYGEQVLPMLSTEAPVGLTSQNAAG